MLALFTARRNGDLFFHISPVTQFRRPNSLAWRIPCATKTRPPIPRSVSATRNFRLVPGRHVQHPVRVDVNSDFNLRQATWRWRDPIEMELPKPIWCPQSSHASHEDLDENTWLFDNVRRERLSLLHEKGGVAFDELRNITCSLQTHRPKSDVQKQPILPQ